MLLRTLRSTNTIENLNGSIKRATRNVNRWRSGSMILRWAVTALIEAESRFRRVRGPPSRQPRRGAQCRCRGHPRQATPECRESLPSTFTVAFRFNGWWDQWDRVDDDNKRRRAAHDLSKYTDGFQARLDGSAKPFDHAAPGARVMTRDR